MNETIFLSSAFNYTTNTGNISTVSDIQNKFDIQGIHVLFCLVYKDEKILLQWEWK